MKKQGSNIVLILVIVIILLIAIIFISGYFGMLEAKQNNANCELGLSKYFCWKWSKMVLVK